MYEHHDKGNLHIRRTFYAFCRKIHAANIQNTGSTVSSCSSVPALTPCFNLAIGNQTLGCHNSEVHSMEPTVVKPHTLHREWKSCQNSSSQVFWAPDGWHETRYILKTHFRD
jgi:hypothetical protein